MIDTHIHLTSEDYYKNPEEIINNLTSNNIEWIVNVATEIKTSIAAIKISQKFQDKSYATVGVHPEEIKTDVNDNIVNQLEDLLKNKQVIAVGEVGLDKTYLSGLNQVEYTKRFKWQNNWFDTQVNLATKHDLPLVIHSRDTTKEMLEKIKGFNNKVRFVWHCFIEDLAVAKNVIENGGYISFTGIITYKNAKNIEEVLKYVPDDRYMLETDGPYLTPEPLRKQGIKINMPWYVLYIAQKIAEVKNQEVEDVIQNANNNSRKFFSI